MLTGRLKLKTQGDSGGEGGSEADMGRGCCLRWKVREEVEEEEGSWRAGRETRR